MSADIPNFTSTRAEIDARLDKAAPHLRPLFLAVRDMGCRLAFVAQTTEGEPPAFRFPGDRPVIVFLGDDFDTATGPAGFHKPSLRRLLRQVCGAVVVSCEPLPKAYASAAATAAMLRRHTLLVETRPEQEIPWLALIQKARPGMPILCATVEGGRA